MECKLNNVICNKRKKEFKNNFYFYFPFQIIIKNQNIMEKEQGTMQGTKENPIVLSDSEDDDNRRTVRRITNPSSRSFAHVVTSATTANATTADATTADAPPTVRADGVIVSSSAQGKVIRNMATVTKAIKGASVAGGAAVAAPAEVGVDGSILNSRGNPIGFGSRNMNGWAAHNIIYRNGSFYNPPDGGRQLYVASQFHGFQINPDNIESFTLQFDLYVAQKKAEHIANLDVEADTSKEGAIKMVKISIKRKWRDLTGNPYIHQWMSEPTTVAIQLLRQRFHEAKFGILAYARAMSRTVVYKRGVTLGCCDGAIEVHIRNVIAPEQLNFSIYFVRLDVPEPTFLAVIMELGKLIYDSLGLLLHTNINYDHPSHPALLKRGNLIAGLPTAPHFNVSNCHWRHATIWKLRQETCRLQMTFALYGSDNAEAERLGDLTIPTPVIVPADTKLIDCFGLAPAGAKWVKKFLQSPMISELESRYVNSEWLQAGFRLGCYDPTKMRLRTHPRVTILRVRDNYLERITNKLVSYDEDISECAVGDVTLVTNHAPFFTGGELPYRSDFGHGDVVVEAVFHIYIFHEDSEDPLL